MHTFDRDGNLHRMAKRQTMLDWVYSFPFSAVIVMLLIAVPAVLYVIYERVVAYLATVPAIH